MRKIVSIAASLAVPVALAPALAGCVSNESASPATAPPPTTLAATGGAANGPMRPPGGPNLAAEDICVKAVQQQTNAEGVAIIASEASQTQTLVMVGYPAAPAPWRCLVSPEGRVTEVGPTGS